MAGIDRVQLKTGRGAARHLGQQGPGFLYTSGRMESCFGCYPLRLPIVCSRARQMSHDVKVNTCNGVNYGIVLGSVGIRNGWWY